jgi:hypothetical protein
MAEGILGILDEVWSDVILFSERIVRLRCLGVGLGWFVEEGKKEGGKTGRGKN